MTEKYWLKFFLFNFIVLAYLELIKSQPNIKIDLLDKQFENEPYYLDLSYLNSNFENFESLKNKFSARNRNGAGSNKQSCHTIKQIPSNVRNDLKLAFFYQKYTEAYGVPVIGSNKVSINSLKRACYVLRFFLSGAALELKETFYKRNVRVVVLAVSESLLNVPELNSLPAAWSSLRGLSATPAIPLITVGEENLQCGHDKLKGEDLLFHQLSYSGLALDAFGSGLKEKLNECYNSAKSSTNLLFQTSDVKEYFASSLDEYFGVNRKEVSKPIDQNMLNLIQTLYPCNVKYLNKCKTTRESENSQVLKHGTCELEVTITMPSKSMNREEEEITYEITSRRPQPTTTTTTTTTTTIKTTTTSATTTTSNNKKQMNENTLININNQEYGSSPLIFKSSQTAHTTSKIEIEEKKPKEECKNLNPNCEQWAAKGQCVRNRHFMQIECKKSCTFCAGETRTTTKPPTTTTKLDLSIYENLCKDEFSHCAVFALRGDCKTNPHHMLDKCKRSCNLCGDLVHEKDRIQPTTKKSELNNNKRPSSQSTRHPEDLINNGFLANFKNYSPSTTSSTRQTMMHNNNYWRSTSTTTTKKVDYYNNNNNNNKNNRENERLYEERKQVGSIEACVDKAGHCSQLAKRGDCVSSRATMEYYCPKSCRFC